MSENNSKMKNVPVATSLRDSNPISQESSTPVGLPAGEKNGEDRSRTLWANRTGSSINRKQFWLARVTRGHCGWCHSTEDKISYIFLSPDRVPIWRRFGVAAKENEISEKDSWLPWQRPLKILKSRFRSFMYSHSGTEWTQLNAKKNATERIVLRYIALYYII